MPPWLLIAVHWLHVFLAIWWFGSVLVDRIETRRALRLAGEEVAAALRAAEERLGGRRNTFIQSVGTVTLGIVRGALGGAFERLDEPYGVTYLAALVVGVAMLAWLWLPLPERWHAAPYLRALYVAAFPIMFTLMVLMRFGY